ncbi:hypothetical protein [Brevundimonas subvibrioides]|uniref:hypothetical protein n=1 Tax=Brevundimonas subvibrioides TaxID=74313 RepID=UPI0022B327C6|nr:hypothetical protein [Brevundimonas subvibrioides]
MLDVLLAVIAIFGSQSDERARHDELEMNLDHATQCAAVLSLVHEAFDATTLDDHGFSGSGEAAASDFKRKATEIAREIGYSDRQAEDLYQTRRAQILDIINSGQHLAPPILARCLHSQ